VIVLLWTDIVRGMPNNTILMLVTLCGMGIGLERHWATRTC